jgi:hypothetical protein
MIGTLWTAAAIGLLAVCMAGCGNGANMAADLCNKLQACDELSLRNVTTVSQCTANVLERRSQLSQPSDGDLFAADQAVSAADQAIEQCLAISDCPSFANCVSTVINQDLPP